jgi:hypothetical protein
MKQVARTGRHVVSLATICLSVAAGDAQAITVESQSRNVTLFTTTTSTVLPGSFNQGVSWANGSIDIPYDATRGVAGFGAQGYQDSYFTHDSSAMTAGGIGEFGVWLPKSDDLFVGISSLFDFVFSPDTNASYTFSTNVDGGDVSFQDMTTNVPIYDGTGNLLAGHRYQVTALATINVQNDLTYGLNSRGYWGFGLQVAELLTPVPEPETYAMLLAGLGLIGVVTRRRKQELNA